MFYYAQERRNCGILEGEKKFNFVDMSGCMGVSSPWLFQSPKNRDCRCLYFGISSLCPIIFVSVLFRDCHGLTVGKEGEN